MRNKYMPKDMVKEGFRFCMVCRKIFIDKTCHQKQIVCEEDNCRDTYKRMYAHFKKVIGGKE